VFVLRSVSAAVLLIGLASPACAQSYPSRAITLAVSTTPGASPDLIARLFGQQLSDALKQPVVIENKGGANGQIAVAAVAQAAPDGYTFLATTGATLTVNPALYPKTGQVAPTRLVPVTRFAHQDFVITARQSMDVRTLSELIDWTKRNPGKLNVSTTALGSLAYLTAHLFKQAADIEFVTVPHNGGGLAVGAVLGDHADILVETVSLSRPYIEAGKLVPIATTGPRRSAFLPAVPTLKELGLEGCETVGWTAMVAPKGTPEEIINQVQSVLASSAHRPEVKKRLEDLSAEPVVNTPEEFGREWRDEMQMWDGVIKKAGIKFE
jgi:tripartite-type tricarboxylate transporter receptor subunit TctC